MIDRINNHKWIVVVGHCQLHRVCFCAESSKFSYTPGKIYEYAYESNTRTTIPGSMEEQASLQMRANVQLVALSPCEMAVKVRPVDNFPILLTSRFQYYIYCTCNYIRPSIQCLSYPYIFQDIQCPLHRIL